MTICHGSRITADCGQFHYYIEILNCTARRSNLFWSVSAHSHMSRDDHTCSLNICYSVHSKYPLVSAAASLDFLTMIVVQSLPKNRGCCLLPMAVSDRVPFSIPIFSAKTWRKSFGRILMKAFWNWKLILVGKLQVNWNLSYSLVHDDVDEGVGQHCQLCKLEGKHREGHRNVLQRRKEFSGERFGYLTWLTYSMTPARLWAAYGPQHMTKTVTITTI